jgi:outer membrane lipoprotein carrier protein
MLWLRVAALFFALYLDSSYADDLSPLLHRFEAIYRSAHTLKVVFIEQYSENGKLVRSEAGTAFFRRPGRMRWEYEKPEKNLFLVDGKTAWFYTPVDRTATKIPARQSDDWRTPLALLAGEGKLSKICERVVAAKIPPSLEVDATPSDGATFECVLRSAEKDSTVEGHLDPTPRVFLQITGKGELARVRIQSSGSVLTEFSFKHWEINPPLAEALFRFDPPPGVVIVDGLLPSPPSVRQ